VSGFVEQLKLAEKAREDIYFEKVNRELIEALHRRDSAEKEAAAHAETSVAGDKKQAEPAPGGTRQAGSDQ
jgi:hypothetical protein